MKKSFIALAVMAFSFAVFNPFPGDAEARRYKANWRERVCANIERSEIRAWKKFDQDKKYRIKQVQKRINWQDRFGCEPNGTIVEQLVERKQFSTLAFALTEAGLVDTFNSPGDYTVFAPTNQAFEKLGSTLDAVLADPALLASVLGYHVVDPAIVTSAVPSEVAVTLTSAPMFNGDSVDISLRDGKLFIDDSQVIVTDLETTNGIVHVIDTVLVP
jgi:uncharacterized surface protein with fasciclin (FAS1) repeats